MVGSSRACGVGPTSSSSSYTSRQSSPRPRGWSGVGPVRVERHPVVPAPAGVVRTARPSSSPGSRRPRADGWSATDQCAARRQQVSSPRTRGWSRHLDRLGDRADVIPAHAGVVRRAASGRARPIRHPRARGGDPVLHGGACLAVIPAHAGVVPKSPTPRTGSRGRLGARGDGPTYTPVSRVNPTSSPCMRGGPFTVAKVDVTAMSSRARGWSDLMPTLVLQVEVVPATQGSPDAVGVTFVCLVLSPRTRGDPDLFKQFGILRASSPHMRGWSGVRRRLRTERSVVPARAGVVPATR